MKHFSSEKLAYIVFGVLVVCFSAISFALATWTAPAFTPQTGDASAPLNVSSAAQGKLGNLGIGTTSPTTNLDVNGTIRIRGGSPASGYVLTATDVNGNAVWAPCPSPQGPPGPQGP